MGDVIRTGSVIWRLHGEYAEGLEERLEELEPDITLQLESARIAGEQAYAPYSNFRVGASIYASGEKGRMTFPGNNIENASYGATMCAERVAIYSAIAGGYRKFDILALSTLDSANAPELSQRSPCGLCRQVMSEFFTPETLIAIDGGKDESGCDRVDLTTINTVLPWRFELSAEASPSGE